MGEAYTWLKHRRAGEGAQRREGTRRKGAVKPSVQTLRTIQVIAARCRIALHRVLQKGGVTLFSSRQTRERSSTS